MRRRRKTFGSTGECREAKRSGRKEEEKKIRRKMSVLVERELCPELRGEKIPFGWHPLLSQLSSFIYIYIYFFSYRRPDGEKCSAPPKLYICFKKAMETLFLGRRPLALLLSFRKRTGRVERERDRFAVAVGRNTYCKPQSGGRGSGEGENMARNAGKEIWI